MKFAQKYLRAHIWAVVLSMAFLVLTDLAQLAVPRVIQRFFDMLAGALPDSGHTLRDYLLVAALILGIEIFVAVSRMGWRIIMWRRARQIEYEIRRELFDHMRQLDISFYHRRPVGDLLSRATHDINNVNMFIRMGIAVFIDILVYVPVALVMMIRIDPLLTLIVALPVLLGPLLSRALMKRVYGSMKAAQDSLGDLTARVSEDIGGTRVLKSFAREGAARGNFRKVNSDYMGKALQVAKFMSFIGPYFVFMTHIGMVLLLAVGGVWVARGRLTLGEWMAFQGYMVILAWPAFALGWGLTIVQRARASAARLVEIFQEPRRERRPAVEGPSEIQGELDFNRLSFSYNGKQIIRELSLSVPRGTMLGITGPTGSGKSTLLGLASGLLESPPGGVRIDGTNLSAFSPETLRKYVILVDQSPYIFSRTIQENLAFGAPDASSEQLDEVVRLCGLEEEIKQFDDGLDTMVGGRGVTLSGGQRLRCALARAVLLRPRILLLDDVFSAVDVSTEQEIWTELARRRAGVTTIIVSHRISVLRRCDRIAVIEGGKVSEVGTHSELINNGGFYSRTFALQDLFEK